MGCIAVAGGKDIAWRASWARDSGARVVGLTLGATVGAAEKPAHSVRQADPLSHSPASPAHPAGLIAISAGYCLAQCRTFSHLEPVSQPVCSLQAYLLVSSVLAAPPAF